MMTVGAMMKTWDARASNVFWSVVVLCFASCFYYQYTQMLQYRTVLGDFVPNVTITGVFTYTDYGKSFQNSRIAGHMVVDAANYLGGNRGFGRGLGIPNGATVTADIAEINTKNGKVWVPASIKSGNQQFVLRSPQEMYDAWRSHSYELVASQAFFHTVFISAALFAVCCISSALFRRTRP